MTPNDEESVCHICGVWGVDGALFTGRTNVLWANLIELLTILAPINRCVDVRHMKTTWSGNSNVKPMITPFDIRCDNSAFVTGCLMWVSPHEVQCSLVMKNALCIRDDAGWVALKLWRNVIISNPGNFVMGGLGINNMLMSRIIVVACAINLPQ